MLNEEQNNRVTELNHCHLPHDSIALCDHILLNRHQESNLLNVFMKLESVQATQLKFLMMEKLLLPETKKTGRKGQNDNGHRIPETEPGT